MLNNIDVTSLGVNAIHIFVTLMQSVLHYVNALTLHKDTYKRDATASIDCCILLSLNNKNCLLGRMPTTITTKLKFDSISSGYSHSQLSLEEVNGFQAHLGKDGNRCKCDIRKVDTSANICIPEVISKHPHQCPDTWSPALISGHLEQYLDTWVNIWTSRLMSGHLEQYPDT